MGAPPVRKHKFFALSWGVAITLAAGLGASILGAWILERVNEQQAQEAIIAATEEAAESVLTRLGFTNTDCMALVGPC